MNENILPGVVMAKMPEEKRVLFEFLHANGVTWNSGCSLIDEDGNLVLMSDSSDGFEILCGCRPGVLWFKDTEDHFEYLEEDEDFDRARELGTYLVDVRTYIESCGGKSKTDFDSSSLSSLL